MLYFAGDPDDFSENDFQKRELEDCFRLAGFSLDEIKVFDSRCDEDLKSLMNWADVVYLAGGKGPTENDYINEAGLKEALSNFEGIFIGLSAGSINAADDVFMFPEFPGEASDPDFPYHMKGLGLTQLNIIPHIQYYVRQTFDGKRLIEDILMPESDGRRFYLITDGSYFVIKGMLTSFYGKGWALENGKLYELKNGPVYVGLSGLNIRSGHDVSSESGFDAVFQTVSDLLRLLGDSSRVKLFWILCHCEECVINLSAMVDMSSPTVSHRLKQLKSAGLIVLRGIIKEFWY